MKKSGCLMTGIGGLVVLLLIGGAFFVSGYNKAAQMEETVRKAWGNVENVLQRRFDLIPNLVETVKGYASHEEEIFTRVAEARSAYQSAVTPKDKIAATNAMEGALSRLLAVVENYPDLKASENFLRLQDELAGTENRIAVERNRYNEEAEIFRSYSRSLIGGLFIKIRGIDWEKYDYFQAAEGAQTAPQVKFD
ncbi:MAG: LemA family protein [Candidatus Aminicenantes bacterium]|nr:LemA family protein [Candidatus Aminicenantes bacterium]